MLTICLLPHTHKICSYTCPLLPPPPSPPTTPHHSYLHSKVAGTTLGVMTMSEMKEKCIFFSMSQAWQLGRAVLRAQHKHTNILDAITEQQNGIILITGKVSLCREDSSSPLLDLYPGFFLCVVGTRLLTPPLHVLGTSRSELTTSIATHHVHAACEKKPLTQTHDQGFYFQ